MGGRPGDRHRGSAVASGAVRELHETDRSEFEVRLRETWGSTRMVSRDRLFEITDLPGFVAEREGEWLGHAVYDVERDALENCLLESVVPGVGAGGALMARCVEVARSRELGRVWLVTTNDNLDALRFYQRHGFVLVTLHRDSVTRARAELKPEIGLVGESGIPIRDELELELPAAEWGGFVERYGWPLS